MSKIKHILSLIIGIIILTPIISAFGVNTMYWDTNPAILAPGQTADLQISLQNNIGGDNLTVYAELNSEIAEITDPEKKYSVPFGATNVPVHIRVKIPKNATNNTNYRIMVLFTPNIDYGETGGLVQFDTKTSGDIYVKVITPPEAEKKPLISTNTITTIVAVLLVILIAAGLAYFFKKKKTKQQPIQSATAQEVKGDKPAEIQNPQKVADATAKEPKTAEMDKKAETK